MHNIRDTLKAHGVELVVAILPAKTRLYRQYLPPERQPSNVHQTLYERIHRDLQQAQIKAPSLLEPMLKANHQHPVFLSTDTHWSPWGAESVAKALSDFIKEQSLALVDTKTFSTEVIEKKPHQGDLLNYLPLSPWFDFMNPFTDTIEVKKTTEQAREDVTHTEAALFADTHIAVTLVGSSYSANPLWHFAGALTQHLGTDLLNLAQEGQGPLRPIQAYIQSDEFKNHPPKLVIWEFPERYLLKDNARSEKKTF
jgi:alginate O-acetyltransferase complex protein AlgJ